MILPIGGNATRGWTPGKPAVILGTRTGSSPYDLHPDGKRLAAAAVEEQGDGVQDKVVFAFNFAVYLRKIAPGTK